MAARTSARTSACAAWCDPRAVAGRRHACEHRALLMLRGDPCGARAPRGIDRSPPSGTSTRRGITLPGRHMTVSLSAGRPVAAPLFVLLPKIDITMINHRYHAGKRPAHSDNQVVQAVDTGHPDRVSLTMWSNCLSCRTLDTDPTIRVRRPDADLPRKPSAGGPAGLRRAL